MDECGLQVNNEPGKVVATKGSRDVHHVTSGERGETISLIACCNAEGKFLPPYCIFKGKRKKIEFEDGMPPGSQVTMNETSAYVNPAVFLDWLKNHFIPRKEQGKVLLILDGHRSHCSDVNVLDFAAENNVIILCLPGHTTHYLQPLDRSFFKPLKIFWQQALKNSIHSNPGRKITRLQSGKFLSTAWYQAAKVGNGSAGFSACGIYPYDPQKIPGHAFAISDRAADGTVPTGTEGSAGNVREEETPVNPQTTDEASVASTSTNSADSRNTSFESISPIPLVKKPKLTGRKKQRADILTAAEQRMTM
jgi:hypothetical protein